MADDIDIEEHDVMENPLIKNMFPDIRTIIKHEVEDYEEEDNAVDLEDDHPYHNYFLPIEESNDSHMFHNKIIIGTKPSTSQTPELSFQNKIILGSKPRTPDITDQTEESEPYENHLKYNLPEAVVVLEDWSNFLMNNPCYCEACKILFPTENVLDSHKMTAHSFLVAVGNNMAVKSFSKSSVASRIKLDLEDVERKDFVCNHCNEVFPNEIALIKHTYELLPGKFECDECELVFEHEVALRTHQAGHSAGPVAERKYLLCSICNCHFRLFKRLYIHMLTQHHAKSENVVLQQRASTNFKCEPCGYSFKGPRQYNCHVQAHHANMYYKKVGEREKEKTSKFKCPQCNLSFSSDYSVRIHRAAKHGHVDNAKSPTNSSKAPLPVKGNMQNMAVNKFRPVPKSTLYKCNKCRLHFVSCVSTLLHTRDCVPNQAGWKCPQCRHHFRLTDRAYHRYQHSISDKFKVIDMSDNIVKKILCRCSKCKVCFDERTFMRYHGSSCSGKTPAYPCGYCDVRVHPRAKALHCSRHKGGLGLLADFIVIDYVHIALADSKTSNKKLYLYCPTCKCYMQRNRSCDQHNIGQCNATGLKVTCKLCGLRFTAKGMKAHGLHHKSRPNLKLSDFRFLNIQNDKRINPPLPDFEMCKCCRVRFFSSMALNNHECNTEEARRCAHCGDVFSDLAYILHVAFHEYPAEPKPARLYIPKIMKKYESLKQDWNILFLCQTCDVVVDNYDRAVEHCQDHYCNMESYNVTIEHCQVCDLKFMDDCHRRHRDLHLGHDINKTSFTILPYQYDTLMTEAWLDIFNTLTQEQVDPILSKTMYMFTRCLRMETVAEGPLDRTLYRCGACKLIVAGNKAAEHAEQQSTRCRNNVKKFNCSICRLPFATKAYRDAHMSLGLHVTLANRPFRIVQFMADPQIASGCAKLTENQDELKFIRCQHCGRLINKKKYKTHMTYHYYYDKMKKLKANPKLLAKHKLRAPTMFVHNFYKCRECNLCVSKKSIKSHYCLTECVTKKCSKCSLPFRTQNLKSHLKYHERYKFTRKNMNIMYFENGVIIQKPIPLPKLTASVASNEHNDIAKGSITFFKCKCCSMSIYKKRNVQRHSCSVSKCRTTCTICNLVIRASHMNKHKHLHKLKKFTSKDVNIVEFRNGKLVSRKQDNSTTKPMLKNRKRPSSSVPKTTATKRPKLSGDVGDNVPSVKRDNKRPTRFVYRGYFSREAFGKFYKCKTCKLLFVTLSSVLGHEESCRGDSEGVQCNDCGLLLHASSIAEHDQVQKCKLRKLSEVAVVTLQRAGKYPHTESNWLYWCEQCNVYNISFGGTIYHFNRNHKLVYNLRKCDKCDITFSAGSYATHVKIHHGAEDLLLSDIGIAVVEGKTMKSLKKEGASLNKHPEFGIEPIHQDSIIESNVPKNDENESKGIYNCKICGINFLNIKTLRSHISRRSHGIKQHSCPECGLGFSYVSIKLHMQKHHRGSRKKIKIEYPNESEAVSDLGAVETVSNVIVESTVSREAVAHAPDCNKLFKCSVCDVHFLTAETCAEHANDHIALDPTEYIACKMCELQFSCEHLGKHMKSHRDKTFCIDKLIVAEYQPAEGGGGVTIDTYLAADRLKSKLVSTTTHFDTEDEKDKSVNCVDSTTEYVIEGLDSSSVNEPAASVACSEADTATSEA